ncbi:MAG TPA: methylmalonyl-CoA mutase family protein [Planctomycetaceae bacterium]|nr:methylmalonyl-CoA mutase family protein [Planctomycetaceae bacterium]
MSLADRTSAQNAGSPSPRQVWERLLAESEARATEFTTQSGRVVPPLFTGDDLPADIDQFPAEYPYTRGIHANMYRGRLWTMRQFAGFGTAAETNERFHFLLKQGQTGLSTAFDLPTLMGLDSDDPRAIGEVGRLGVAIDTVHDMRRLFEGIDLGNVSVSMTINAPAAVILAFFLVVAEEQGVPWSKLQGTLQNDILKEYHAQNEYVFPPDASVGLVIDTIEFCTREVPKWNTVSISGYHIREAGATAAQELAFTLADGFHYVEQSLARGLAVDDFAPRLSFFFNAHNDLFEEIAKFRAARRIWARHLREKYGAQSDRSWKLRFHAQTSGVSLQAQQPEVNLIRVAYQALAAVLGGCQSLHTNSLDETLALPSEHAATLALRTQQVLAHETGVTNVADPLGGSYLVENWTATIEAEAERYFERIAAAGGMIAAIGSGFFRREIAEAAYRQQQAIESGRKLIVGVNAFTQPEDRPVEILKIDQQVEIGQKQSLQQVKSQRNAALVTQRLDELKAAARERKNVMPALIEAARASVTVGEMMRALGEVFGRYSRQAGE